MHALILNDLGKYDEAQEKFELSLKVNPVYVRNILRYAKFNIEMDNLMEAKSLINDALEYCYTVNDLIESYKILKQYYEITNQMDEVKIVDKLIRLYETNNYDDMWDIQKDAEFYNIPFKYSDRVLLIVEKNIAMSKELKLNRDLSLYYPIIDEFFTEKTDIKQYFEFLK